MTYVNPVLPVLLVCVLVAAALRKRAIALVAALALFLWLWPPFAWLAASTLEARYPERKLEAGDAQAIVVLASNLIEASPPGTSPGLAESMYVRCHYAAWLHRNWKPVPVLASGGRLKVGGQVMAVSPWMAEFLRNEGVPAASVWIEDRSTSTYENAVFSAAILRAHGIRRVALVTEAYHMARAERCFRKQGLEVLPAPCGWFMQKFAGLSLMPKPSAAAANDGVLHEWIGMTWYRISGKA